jgi:hypothetical protein
MTIAPPEISDPLAQEAPHATVATEVGLNDDAVCRVGHGIIVQIVPPSVSHWAWNGRIGQHGAGVERV